MFDIGIEKLIVAVSLLLVGWYAHGGFTVFRRWLDRRRGDALKVRRRADRTQVIALIEQAIAAEDTAIGIFKGALERVRETGKIELHESWKQMQDIRNNLNRYCGLCGRIEDTTESSMRAETMINRFRCGQDPLDPKPKKSGPQRKAASG
jgi:hypothetical protein